MFFFSFFLYFVIFTARFREEEEWRSGQRIIREESLDFQAAMLSFQRKKIKGFEGFQFSSITLLFQSLRLVVKMMMAVLFFCLSMKFYKYTYKKQKKLHFFFYKWSKFQLRFTCLTFLFVLFLYELFSHLCSSLFFHSKDSRSIWAV